MARITSFTVTPAVNAFTARTRRGGSRYSPIRGRRLRGPFRRGTWGAIEPWQWLHACNLRHERHRQRSGSRTHQARQFARPLEQVACGVGEHCQVVWRAWRAPGHRYWRLTRFGSGVQQRGQHDTASDAVDGGMVDFGDERHRTRRRPSDCLQPRNESRRLPTKAACDPKGKRQSAP